MKAWSIAELEQILKSLSPLVGGRLQEVLTGPSEVALGFYIPNRVHWLWVDLNPLRPLLLPWTDLPRPLARKKTPLQLFLKAHFANRILTGIERDPNFGRVVHLDFGPDYRIEIRAYPHGANFLAQAGPKSISWEKPEPLKPPVEMGTSSPVRTLDQMREQWMGAQKSAKGKKSVDPRVAKEKELAKKKSALQKIEKDILEKESQPWRELGEWLKREQSLDVPSEWSAFIDRRRKLSWNIEQTFSRVREVEGKIHGGRERAEILKVEISKLEQVLQGDAPIVARDTSHQMQPLKMADADGKTLRLSEELVAVMGRNAQDNLKLLRKARSWDFWLHIQDEPGSHIILFRNRQTSVADAALRQVIEWYLKQKFGAKHAQQSGEKFKFIVTECRHVRPIKGDRLGRVNYQNERILIYQVP